jgi:hypothetical protein
VVVGAAAARDEAPAEGGGDEKKQLERLVREATERVLERLRLERDR